MGAGEIDRLLKLFDMATAQNASYEDALRPVFKAVLVSPHFLFRIERDRAADAAYRVNDHELAVRLSYFLWSSMPDEELSGLADRGHLSRPEVFEGQARRMMASPKAAALTESFASQWLQLRKLAEARPSTEFFPTFTPAAASGDAGGSHDLLRPSPPRGPERRRAAERRLHLS